MKARLSRGWLEFAAVAVMMALTSLPAWAQQWGGNGWGNGIHSTYNGHFLAPAPSVTSIGGIGAAHLPPPLPSVTSLPNYLGPRNQYGYNHSFSGRYNHNLGGYFGAYSYGYGIPYYYAMGDPGYGYDYVGGGGEGPPLYSGPPLGPGDPSEHMIAEEPPASAYNVPQPLAQPTITQPDPPPPEVKPGDPTVLVFRDGHRQQVTNYAIMGNTLYDFDHGRKMIALAELDLPATIKANDDCGMDFTMPPATQKAGTTVPQRSSPSQTAPPASIASAAP